MAYGLPCLPVDFSSNDRTTHVAATTKRVCGSIRFNLLADGEMGR